MKTFFTIFSLIFIQWKLISQSNINAISSGNWNNPNIWSTLSVPTLSDNVNITNGNTVTIDNNSCCNDIGISPGGQLNSDSAKILNVKGSWINNGNYNSGKGVIMFNGTNTQTIGGSSETSFYKLTVNNPTGVSLASDVSLKFLLTVNAGTFSTAGYQFTLLSDSLTTASIGPLLGGADVSGNISVQRYISSSATGWRFLGSPVRTTLMDWSDDFITTGFPGSTYPDFGWTSVYSYDETVPGTSDYGYITPSTGDDSIGTGVGYWCWIGPTPSLIKVSGTPVKFNQTFSITLTPSAGKGEDGWNMIANPYPSAIDWDSPSWTKSGIVNAVYIWDPELEQYSTYINGIGTNGGTNIIPSSQAFWIEADQTNPVLSCTEEVKTTTDKTFLRTVNSNEKMPVKLTLSGNNYKDETVVCFSEGSSSGISSGEDALKLFSDNALVPSISSMVDSMEMVINSLPNNQQEISVPIKVKVGVSGIYAISGSEDLNVPNNMCIYLEDRVTGIFTDLRMSPSYTFQINDTTSAARFLLHMSKPIAKTAGNTSCSYAKNGMAIVNYTTVGLWNTTWKDNNNNIIAVHADLTVTDTLKNIAAGIYNVIISDVNGKCSSLSESITVNKPADISVNKEISDNICRNTNNGVINAFVSGGSAPYQYKWSNNKTTAMVQNLASGIYTLIVTDEQGCLDTTFHEVKTLSGLTANFEIENDTNNLFVNEPIIFNNTSVASNNCLWDFGNGTNYLNSPSNIYTVPGTYTITLVSNDMYCQSSAKKTINVRSRFNTGTINELGEISIYNSGEEAVIQFDLKEQSESFVTVYTIDGKLINSQKVQALKNKTSIGLGESHGIYIISVETNGNKVQSKVIK